MGDSKFRIPRGCTEIFIQKIIALDPGPKDRRLALCTSRLYNDPIFRQERFVKLPIADSLFRPMAKSAARQTLNAIQIWIILRIKCMWLIFTALFFSARARDKMPSKLLNYQTTHKGTRVHSTSTQPADGETDLGGLNDSKIVHS